MWLILEELGRVRAKAGTARAPKMTLATSSLIVAENIIISKEKVL
jgi:hypothetical protein